MSYLLPTGITNPSTFDWNTLDINGVSMYTPSTFNYSNSWAGFSGTFSQDGTKKEAEKAASAGNPNKSKVLYGIVTYGPVLVSMIATIIYALKGKKISNPSELTEQDGKDILAYGKGNLDPATLAAIYAQNGNGGNREAEIFGIKTSTLVVVAAVVLVIFLVKPKEKKRRR